MSIRVGATSAVERDDPRLTVQEVRSANGIIRISGITNPPWAGPPEAVRVRIGMDYAEVQAVEHDAEGAGLFAVEVAGVLMRGNVISISLGDAWTVVEVDAR